MDFSFTEEQQMLRDSVSRFLDKTYDFKARQTLVASEKPWSEQVWQQFAELGLLALPFSEETGGLGGSIADVVAIAESFGEHLLVEPYMSSILLAGRALALSDHDVAQDWLAKIIAGEAIAAFAHEEARGTAAPEFVTLGAQQSGGNYFLDGEKRLVLNGAEADILVVSARLSGVAGEKSGLALMMVDPKTDGIEITSFQTIDGRSAAHIQFDKVQVSAEQLLLDDAYSVLVAVISDIMIALSAEAVGIMGALLGATSEYTATRKQFDVPISSFQVIAHRLADMKIAYTKARASLYYTTAIAEAGQSTARDIAILKGQVGKLGRAIGEDAIQSHGGVGMTDELIISHYHKRLIAIDAMFGDSEYHFRKIGQAHD
ncbi:pilus assembly protein CpaB [Sphingomonadales bacterium EhC05]|nr:pilus assembly protein CpaB [Sphingomonadales bacterium EhC05]